MGPWLFQVAILCTFHGCDDGCLWRTLSPWTDQQYYHLTFGNGPHPKPSLCSGAGNTRGDIRRPEAGATSPAQADLAALRDILAPMQATTRATEETPYDEERFAASLAHQRDRCVARHVARKRKRRRLSADRAECQRARERLRWAGGRGRRRECHLFQSRWPDPHPARAGRWRAASRQAFYQVQQRRVVHAIRRHWCGDEH